MYFVHNRVESIFSLGNLITRLVPEARVVVGHGQMSEEELERAMVDFVAHKYDVLLATTIIENGLDIPNANTIIINRADRYGLSQLYQLRGRVGRSDRRAYAYLLIPPEDTLSPVAKKRLAAIREFSDLGSGFRVAALDLEIRGAGNLLGGEQSGHIEAVGFDMYMKLLEQTIKELKGEELEDELRANVNLRVDLRIDDDVHPGHEPAADRLPPHGRRCGRDEELDRLRRGGARPLRSAARIGAEPGRIRRDPAPGRPDRARVARPRRLDRRPKVQAGREARSRRGSSGSCSSAATSTLVPPATLKLDLKKPAAARNAGSRLRVRSRPARRRRKRGRIRSPVVPGGRRGRQAGEVTPGFTKDEIMRPAKEDPRADGRRLRAGVGPAPRVERGPVDRVKYYVPVV